MRVLWPLAAGAGRNNDSCVVQLDDGRHRLLLSGDIEQQAERRLLALALEEGEGAGLASTPAGEPASWQSHLLHGPFVAAVKPAFVVHSAGFMNQWGFPRPEVVARYQGRGSGSRGGGRHP